MKFDHINHNQARVDTNIGQPFVSYDVATSPTVDHYVFTQGGIICETLKVDDQNHLYIGPSAIEALLDKRLEQYEDTGLSDRGIDALTIISLFPEGTSQEFSLSTPPQPVINEIAETTASELTSSTTDYDEAIDLLSALDAAPTYLRAAVFTKIRSRIEKPHHSNRFVEAYLGVRMSEHGDDLFEATAALKEILQKDAN